MGVSLVKATVDIKELRDKVSKGEPALAPRISAAQLVGVFYRDAMHAKVVVQAFKVNTGESPFHIHAQDGRHFAIPPSVFDHFNHLVQSVSGGPPWPRPKLVPREYASDLSLSDLLQIFGSV
jgi:hypothetical protein